MCVRMYVCVCVCECVCVCVCMCVYCVLSIMCECMCIYVCMYVRVTMSHTLLCILVLYVFVQCSCMYFVWSCISRAHSIILRNFLFSLAMSQLDVFPAKNLEHKLSCLIIHSISFLLVTIVSPHSLFRVLQ